MSGSRPPFEIPHIWRNKAPSGFRERKVLPFSDGDVRTWPGNDLYRAADERNYLIQLATDWAKEEKQDEPGVVFYLDRLPEGYSCFEQDQPGGPQVYKRLFGHPSGRFYDSITKFQVHFQWLMNGMQGYCECVLCSKSTKKPFIPRPRAPREPRETFDRTQYRERNMNMDTDEDGGSSRSDSVEGQNKERRKRYKRQSQVSPCVDEEGTLDIWGDCFRRLENTVGDNKGIEIDIEEPDSVDWKAERRSLLCHLTQIEQQHSFVPRIGELVLWCPEWPSNRYLLRNPVTDEYKFYSFKQERFYSFPLWRGGVVASVPTALTQNGPIDFVDLLDTPKKKTSVNVAGFRIETVPDPNDDLCKSLSKQYRYVPLRNIRPLSHWQVLLKGIRQEELHPSILNALTNSTTISMVEKWRFNGTWPNATIFSKGIYIGAELITIGDAIRLIPRTTLERTRRCTDSLVVESIRYHIKDSRSHQDLLQSLRLDGRSYVTFVGQAFTTDIYRAYNMPTDKELFTTEAVKLPPALGNEDLKTAFRPVGTIHFGPWYRLHSPQQRYEVSYDQILGRLYEADAIKLWSGQSQIPLDSEKSRQLKVDLNFDTDGILAGRRYASQIDARLPEPATGSNPVNWYLADTRAKALTIATLNGVELSSYHSIRTPATVKSWRAHLKIAEGAMPEGSLMQDINAAKKSIGNENSVDLTGKRRGRPHGSKLIEGRLYLEHELHQDLKNAKNVSARAQSMPSTIDEHIEEKQHSSQMADAALASTDEEDITLEIEESDEEEEQVTPSRNRFSLQNEQIQVIQARPTAATSFIHKLEGSREYLIRTTKESSISGSTNSSHVHRSRSSSRRIVKPDPGSFIQNVMKNTEGEQETEMRRVKSPHVLLTNDPSYEDVKGENNKSDDHSEAGDDGDDDDSEDGDSEVDELRRDEWKTARFARGGTEESEGGDYRPGQD